MLLRTDPMAVGHRNRNAHISNVVLMMSRRHDHSTTMTAEKSKSLVREGP